jgi:hypothetical protein
MQRPPDLDANGQPVTTNTGRPPDLDASGAPVSTPHFTAQNEKDAQGHAVVRAGREYLGEATKSLNPVTILGALDVAFRDPINTAKGILSAQDQLRVKAMDSFKGGDYVTGMRHLAEWMLPFIGPRLSEAGDYMQQGEIAKGLGATTDVGAQIALMRPRPNVTLSARVTPRVGLPDNPVDAAAVQFGQSRGVPMDAGTATGSQFLKNVQKRVGSTWGGANTAENAQQASAAGLARVGDDLAQQAAPNAATPVSAGQSVLDRFAAESGKLNTQATKAYDFIRAAEQQQAARINQVGGIRGPGSASKPFTDVAFAVDIADAKASLGPMYREMMRAADIAPPMGADARALQALDRLMQGPDTAPLSVVDRALSDLKALDRQWQGPVKEIVKQLDARVQASAAQAGTDVFRALQEGRTATKAKYAIEEVRDLLSANEPGQVFKQLTANKDTAVNRLKAVQKIAPDELPNVARAYLEDALELATAEGGFGHADRLFASWQNLGTQTKQILFPQKGQVRDLDNFFLLAKRIGHNPNPSGTAATLNATQLLAGIPAWVLAKILYTPKGVQMLTNGLRVSMNTSPAAKTIATAQIAKAAQEAGVSVPAFGESQGRGR